MYIYLYIYILLAEIAKCLYFQKVEKTNNFLYLFVYLTLFPQGVKFCTIPSIGPKYK